MVDIHSATAEIRRGKKKEEEERKKKKPQDENMSAQGGHIRKDWLIIHINIEKTQTWQSLANTDVYAVEVSIYSY